MKSVLIVRHAKSSWGDFTLPDFDRPLNERGKKDAPEMAKRLRSRGIDIQSFISSPAKRARKTATLFAEEFGKSKHELLLKQELYEAGPEVFFEVIENAPEKADIIAIFSHNPGITDFVNRLTTTSIDDMPTCAVFALQCDISSWKEFREAGKNFWFFDYPKNS
jgi:phosphohistidine phosphatase